VRSRCPWAYCLVESSSMGRSIRDVGRLLTTQSGFDPRSPLSMQMPLGWNENEAVDPGILSGMRIGWLGDWRPELRWLSAADRSDSPSRLRPPPPSTASCQRGETPHSQKEAQRSCDDHGAGAAYAPRRRTLPGRASVIEASRITAVPLTKT
jgi:hypothetical protein